VSTQKNLIEILINLIDKSAPGMAQASKRLKNFGEESEKLGKSMMKAGGVVSGAMLGMVKVAANAGDELRDLSIRTGVSIETLSGLKYAAEQSGAGLQDVAIGMRTLAGNLQNASDKGGDAAKAFASIGVATAQPNGQLRKLDDVLLEVADRLKGMTDRTRAAALAQDLFGRGGQQLLPMLNDGSAGIKALTEEARKLGIVWSQEDANAADAFNDSLNKVKNATVGLGRQLLTTLGPALTALATKIATEVLPKLREWSSAHPAIAKAALGLAVAFVGGGGLLVAIGKIAAGWGGLIAAAPKVVAALKAVQAASVMSASAGGFALAGTAATLAITAGTVILTAATVLGIKQALQGVPQNADKNYGQPFTKDAASQSPASTKFSREMALWGISGQMPSIMAEVKKVGEAAGTAVVLTLEQLQARLLEVPSIAADMWGPLKEKLAKMAEDADPFKKSFPGTSAKYPVSQSSSNYGMPVGPKVPSQYESEWRNQQKRDGRGQPADWQTQLTARMTEAKTGIQTWLDTIQGAVENVGNRIGNVFGDAFMSGKLSLKDFGAAFKATMADVIAQIVAASVKMAAFNLIIKLAGGGSPLSFSDALKGNSASVDTSAVTQAARGSSMRQNTDSAAALKAGLDNLASKFDNLASVVVSIPGAPVLIDGRAAGRTLYPWMVEAQARGQ
jgi:hypothetical protein